VSNADDPGQKAEFDRELEQFERTRNIKPSKLVEQGGAETEKATGRWTSYDESGPYATHGTLTLEGNGRFELSVSDSDAGGWAGHRWFRGTWTQEGAQIHFVVVERWYKEAPSQLSPATVHGATLELPDWGTFKMSE
jgi:hypothetical protein